LGIHTKDEGFGSFIGDNRVKQYEEENNGESELGKIEFQHLLSHFTQWLVSD